MKKSTLFLLLFGLISAFQATAQERTIVQGYCKDGNGKAIENVSVYAHDSLLVAITDAQGRFTYNFAKEGDQLRFVHMAFEPSYYTIKAKDFQNKNLTIKMKTRSHELLEVEVTANAPHLAYDNPVMSVIDYTIRDDGIYLIVYRSRNSALLHLSFDMDTLHELPIDSKYQYLCRDAFGDIYALNDHEASLVGFMEYNDDKKGQMNFYYTMSKQEFFDKFSTIVAATDSVFVTGWRHFFGTGLSYYRNTLGSDEKPKLLHYIEDEEASSSIRIRQGQYEVAFIEPVYAPIYAVDNRFYLFAFVDNEILVFDEQGEKIEHHPLTFHEYRKWNGKMVPDRHWKQNMLVDAIRKQFYTFFVYDGVYTLKRIDLQTGAATPIMDLSGYPFADNLRIHDGVLYFIYPTGMNKRKALYQVRVE